MIVCFRLLVFNSCTEGVKPPQPKVFHMAVRGILLGVETQVDNSIHPDIIRCFGARFLGGIYFWNLKLRYEPTNSHVIKKGSLNLGFFILRCNIFFTEKLWAGMFFC